MAMAMQESGMGQWMDGDGSKSWGYFHILLSHGLSKSCMEDLHCSASWSLSRMIHFGFKDGDSVNFAMATHNSLTPAVNLAYQIAVKKQLAKLQ
jgi:hypothetical protein